MPPDRVRCVRVSTRSRLSASHFWASSCWRSRSTTTNLGPVGTPMSASGFSVHHRCTVSASQEASLKPVAVSGRLLTALQGKTGTPRLASFSASVQRFLKDIKNTSCILVPREVLKGVRPFDTFSCETPRSLRGVLLFQLQLAPAHRAQVPDAHAQQSLRQAHRRIDVPNCPQRHTGVD